MVKTTLFLVLLLCSLTFAALPACVDSTLELVCKDNKLEPTCMTNALEKKIPADLLLKAKAKLTGIYPGLPLPDFNINAGDYISIDDSCIIKQLGIQVNSLSLAKNKLNLDGSFKDIEIHINIDAAKTEPSYAMKVSIQDLAASTALPSSVQEFVKKSQLQCKDSKVMISNGVNQVEVEGKCSLPVLKSVIPMEFKIVKDTEWKASGQITGTVTDGFGLKDLTITEAKFNGILGGEKPDVVLSGVGHFSETEKFEFNLGLAARKFSGFVENVDLQTAIGRFGVDVPKGLPSVKVSKMIIDADLMAKKTVFSADVTMNGADVPNAALLNKFVPNIGNVDLKIRFDSSENEKKYKIDFKAKGMSFYEDKFSCGSTDVTMSSEDTKFTLVSECSFKGFETAIPFDVKLTNIDNIWNIDGKLVSSVENAFDVKQLKLNTASIVGDLSSKAVMMKGTGDFGELKSDFVMDLKEGTLKLNAHQVNAQKVSALVGLDNAILEKVPEVALKTVTVDMKLSKTEKKIVVTFTVDKIDLAENLSCTTGHIRIANVEPRVLINKLQCKLNALGSSFPIEVNLKDSKLTGHLVTPVDDAFDVDQLKLNIGSIDGDLSSKALVMKGTGDFGQLKSDFVMNLKEGTLKLNAQNVDAQKVSALVGLDNAILEKVPKVALKTVTVDIKFNKEAKSIVVAFSVDKIALSDTLICTTGNIRIASSEPRLLINKLQCNLNALSSSFPLEVNLKDSKLTGHLRTPVVDAFGVKQLKLATSSIDGDLETKALVMKGTGNFGELKSDFIVDLREGTLKLNAHQVDAQKVSALVGLDNAILEKVPKVALKTVSVDMKLSKTEKKVVVAFVVDKIALSDTLICGKGNIRIATEEPRLLVNELQCNLNAFSSSFPLEVNFKDSKLTGHLRQPVDSAFGVDKLVVKKAAISANFVNKKLENLLLAGEVTKEGAVMTFGLDSTKKTAEIRIHHLTLKNALSIMQITPPSGIPEVNIDLILIKLSEVNNKKVFAFHAKSAINMNQISAYQEIKEFVPTISKASAVIDYTSLNNEFVLQFKLHELKLDELFVCSITTARVSNIGTKLELDSSCVLSAYGADLPIAVALKYAENWKVHGKLIRSVPKAFGIEELTIKNIHLTGDVEKKIFDVHGEGQLGEASIGFKLQTVQKKLFMYIKNTSVKKVAALFNVQSDLMEKIPDATVHLVTAIVDLGEDKKVTFEAHMSVKVEDETFDIEALLKVSKEGIHISGKLKKVFTIKNVVITDPKVAIDITKTKKAIALSGITDFKNIKGLGVHAKFGVSEQGKPGFTLGMTLKKFKLSDFVTIVKDTPFDALEFHNSKLLVTTLPVVDLEGLPFTGVLFQSTIKLAGPLSAIGKLLKKPDLMTKMEIGLGGSLTSPPAGAKMIMQLPFKIPDIGIFKFPYLFTASAQFGVPTKIGLAGKTVVRFPGDTTDLILGARISVSLDGSFGFQCETHNAWVHPFGNKWLTIHKMVLGADINLALIPTKLEVLGYFDFPNVGDVKIAFMYDLKSLAAVFHLSVEKFPLSSLLNIAMKEGLNMEVDLPSIEFRDTEIKVATKDALIGSVQYHRGFLVKGELWVMGNKFAGAHVSVGSNGIIAKAEVSAFELGPLTLRKLNLDLELTRERKEFKFEADLSLKLLFQIDARILVHLSKDVAKFHFSNNLFEVDGSCNPKNPTQFKICGKLKFGMMKGVISSIIEKVMEMAKPLKVLLDKMKDAKALYDTLKAALDKLKNPFSSGNTLDFPDKDPEFYSKLHDVLSDHHELEYIHNHVKKVLEIDSYTKPRYLWATSRAEVAQALYHQPGDLDYKQLFEDKIKSNPLYADYELEDLYDNKKYVSDEVKDLWLGSIVDVVKKAGNAVADTVSEAADKAAELAKKAAEAAKEAYAEAEKAYDEAVAYAKEKARQAEEAAKEIADKAKNLAIEIAEEAAEKAKAAAAYAEKLADEVAEATKAKALELKNKAIEAANKAKKLAVEQYESAKAACEEAYQIGKAAALKAKAAAIEAYEAAKEATIEAAKKAAAAATAVIEKAKEAAKAVMEKINKMIAQVGAVAQKITHLAEEIKNFPLQSLLKGDIFALDTIEFCAWNAKEGSLVKLNIDYRWMSQPKKISLDAGDLKELPKLIFNKLWGSTKNTVQTGIDGWKEEAKAAKDKAISQFASAQEEFKSELAQVAKDQQAEITKAVTTAASNVKAEGEKMNKEIANLAAEKQKETQNALASSQEQAKEAAKDIAAAATNFDAALAKADAIKNEAMQKAAEEKQRLLDEAQKKMGEEVKKAEAEKQRLIDEAKSKLDQQVKGAASAKENAEGAINN